MGFLIEDLKLLEDFAFSRDRAAKLKTGAVANSVEKIFLEGILALHNNNAAAAEKYLEQIREVAHEYSPAFQELQALLNLQKWGKGPDATAQLQEYLTKELGLWFAERSDILPEEGEEGAEPEEWQNPTALTDDQYTLANIFPGQQNVYGFYRPSAMPLIFADPATSWETKRYILQSCSFPTSLPGFVPFLRQWQAECAKQPGNMDMINWLLSHLSQMTRAQLLEFAMGNEAFSSNERLLRNWQATLVFKLHPDDVDMDDPACFQSVYALLAAVEQLCNELGLQAQWIRLHVLYTRLVFNSKMGVVDVDAIRSFYALSATINWQLAFHSGMPSSRDGINSKVHTGVSCDICKTSPIVGTRYHSKKLRDWDACENCIHTPAARQGEPFDAITEDKRIMLYSDDPPLGPLLLLPRNTQTMMEFVQKQLLDAVVADGTIHQGVTCDLCNTPNIKGVRYHSKSRHDWDCCKQCAAKPEAAAAGPFEVIQPPPRVFTAERPDSLSMFLAARQYHGILALGWLYSGAGDQDLAARWYQEAHGNLAELTNRRELVFTGSNARAYGAAEPAVLRLHAKNVPSVLIKVWEINSWNYYSAGKGEIDTNLDLTGVGPTLQETITLSHLPPLRRSDLEYPCLAGRRGIFVVDVVASGMTQRAVIRKGGLRHTMRLGLAGHALKIFYDDWTPVKGGKVFVEGREHQADPETGEIVVPYVADGGTRFNTQVVLGCADGLSSLIRLDLRGETYTLAVTAHVEREALLPRVACPLLLRLGLSLHGTSAPLSLLERLTLAVRAWDASNTEIAQAPVEVTPDADSGTITHQLRVPDNCSRITVNLTGRVQLVAPGANAEVRYQDLSREFSWAVNAQNDSDIYDMYLQGLSDGSYALRVLGRAGEPPRKSIKLRVGLTHCLVQSGPRYFDLSTNAQGTVRLGRLADIESVSAEISESAEGVPMYKTRQWNPKNCTPDGFAYPPNEVNCEAGSPQGLRLTLPPPPEVAAQQPYYKPQLYSMAGSGQIVAEDSSLVSWSDGQLAVAPLPAGTYLLFVPWLTHTVTITVATPVTRDIMDPDWLVAQNAVLPLREPQPLAIAAASCSAAEGLVVQLAGSAEQLADARVTAVLTRFVPPSSFHEFLGSTAPQEMRSVQKFRRPFSDYMAGARMDVGTLYVMQRRALVAAAKGKMRPGNMLDKPSLLVHPLLVRDAESNAADMMAEKFAQSQGPDMMRSSRMYSQCAPMACMAEMAFDDSMLNDLPGKMLSPAGAPYLGFCPSAVLLDGLKCDADGKIVVSPEALTAAGADLAKSGHTFVRIAACTCDGFAFAAAPILGSGATDGPPVRDVGLERPWVGGTPCVEVRDTSVLQPGKSLVIAEPSSAKFCVYDSLERVQLLFAALLQSEGAEWSKDWKDLARWPSLPASERSRILDKQWSCELLTFVKLRDPSLFASAVKPVLACKLKTERMFLDWWLLDEVSPKVVAWFSDPAHYGQLSVFEKILLAAAQGPSVVQRLATDMTSRCKPRGVYAIRSERERQRRLFDMALSVGDLEVPAEGGGGALGDLFAQKQQAEDDYVMVENRTMPVAFGAPAMAYMSAPMAMMDAMPPAPPAPMRMARKAMRSEQDMAQRDRVQANAAQMFKKKVKTQEWVETGFLKQGTSMVAPQFPETLFWADFAAHCGSNPTGQFVSKNLVEAAPSLSSAILAMAVLGLPFPSVSQGVVGTPQGASLLFHAEGAGIVFHRQVLPAQQSPEAGSSASAPVLVAQNIVDLADMYLEDPETGESQEKWVAGPLLAGRAYALAVTCTSLTPSRQDLDLLLPIPQGALPLGQPRPTATNSISLDPFNSWHTVMVSFYFPYPGKFSQSPVAVTRKGALIAGPKEALPQIDVRMALPPGSQVDGSFNWDKFALKASDAELLEFLATGDLTQATNLDAIVPRCSTPSFFAAATAALRARQQFPTGVWMYAVKHMDGQALREYLTMDPRINSRLGQWVEHPLVQVRPTDKGYRHLEYWPTINRFVHPVPRPGAQAASSAALLDDIPAVKTQWVAFLNTLLRKPALEPADTAEAAYYMLLQDRITEVEELLHSLQTPAAAAQLGGELAMQLDYMRAWLAMSAPGTDLSVPLAVAVKYRGLQDKVWGKKFSELDATLSSIQQQGPRWATPANAPQVDPATLEAVLTMKGPVDTRGSLPIYAQNLTELKVNLYEMDIELLFTAQPFAQLAPSGGTASTASLGKLAFVQPSASVTAALASAGGDQSLQLTSLFPQHASASVLFELQGGGLTRTVARYGSGVVVHVMERQGLLQALDAAGKPLVAAYVKVYARQGGGEPWMHKDGYTDRLGKFDYVSVAEVDAQGRKPQEFAVLVVSESLGAAVVEAKAMES